MAIAAPSARAETFTEAVQFPEEQFGEAETPPTFTTTGLAFSEQVPETGYAALFVLLMAVEEVIATSGRFVFFTTVVFTVVVFAAESLWLTETATAPLSAIEVMSSVAVHEVPEQSGEEVIPPTETFTANEFSEHVPLIT